MDKKKINLLKDVTTGHIFYIDIESDIAQLYLTLSFFSTRLNDREIGRAHV